MVDAGTPKDSSTLLSPLSEGVLGFPDVTQFVRESKLGNSLPGLGQLSLLLSSAALALLLETNFMVTDSEFSVCLAMILTSCRC